MDSDKYPGTTSRRRFVKGVLGASVLAGVGTAGGAAVTTATNPAGLGGGNIEFLGIELVEGPAPRGMPLIPVEIGDDGTISGLWPEAEQRDVGGRSVAVAQTDVGGTTYSTEWFQYCGIQDIPAIDPEADQDNTFRYDESSPYDWQSEDVTAGDPMNVADFEDYNSWGNGIGQAGLGKPATGTWRSDGVDSEETLPVQVLRIADSEADRMRQDPTMAAWLDAAAPENVLAWLSKCTHFCCVPGFKSTPQSTQFNAENDVYCPCHQSVYDPFSLVSESFVALPRPEGE
ncbi:ubiquinol-cytochrome c reductase iron-sulfur subunit [Halomarina rubra]|uniref:Ubiquinol-cytochrome c reductase iron-sulfur subunit n=1 Tax=Halomarina rubra TaxID=2071873 RepID=A0ABD6AYV7_9EURY|nr:ubiquinol-cytochrome c reductase iron-sulfur subunit [Halomarina rubra]